MSTIKLKSILTKKKKIKSKRVKQKTYTLLRHTTSIEFVKSHCKNVVLRIKQKSYFLHPLIDKKL